MDAGEYVLIDVPTAPVAETADCKKNTIRIGFFSICFILFGLLCYLLYCYIWNLPIY